MAVLYKDARVGTNRRAQGGAKLPEARADKIVRAFIAVHSRHRIIAFGQVAMLVQRLKLLISGQTRIYGTLRLEAPDAFGAVNDEGAVALIAGSQSFFGAFALGNVLNHHQPVQRVVLRITYEERCQVEPY